MAETADVVVVGGGVIGTSIACALASAGVRHVTVLEKDALASGASRSSALVRMHYTNAEDAQLAWASYPVFRHRSERAAPHMTVVDHVLGTYFRPESGIHTIVGVPCQVWDVDPDTLGTGLPPQVPAEGARILTHRVPAMAGAVLARGCRAFDSYSAECHAILGAVRGIDGVYLATAFSGSGFKIAPAVGTCLAELITEGRVKTVDISAFRPERFAEGRPIESPHPYAPRPDHVKPAR